MLTKPVSFEDKVTLIMNTGVQFLDFALKLELRRELPGEFVVQESNQSLARLEYDERSDCHYHPSRPGTALKSRLSVPVDESARLLDDVWMPVPLLRVNPPRQFAEGPQTWARVRLIALSPEEVDPDQETHRLTLALDTSVFAGSEETKYLAPSPADVQSGASFAFAHRASEIGWFPELPWVAGWIQEAFEDNAGSALRLPPEDIDAEKSRLAHHAHYLNLLALIGHRVRLPEVKLIGNARDDVHRAIAVDMVLDVGNSRTCGILVEEHPKERDGLRWRYELELRDLSHPHRVYSEPFESRVEFAQATFGKEHWAHKSGRADAFLWPTIARVGPEAARLAGRRRGTEGATGISSPKRYLWDEDRFDTGWRFNSAYVRSDIEPRATAAPFCNLVNELGTALYELPEEDRMPVFMPHYSRSSMMMFMLAEVLTQAQAQINSPAQRLRMPNADLPRHLRSIVLTVPPSMPKPEREIFSRRVHQAIALVWKAFGWHPEDEPTDGEGAELAWPPLPRVEVRWDEATCGQIVWLYSESQNSFAGRPAEFFELARRPGAAGGPERLTVATVDIGGGTTDLVINDYRLDEGGRGANRYIVPEQRFRDGFKVAGDDILLEVIRAVLVPSLVEALDDAGVESPSALLSRLMGSDPVDVQESVLRQQLALQIMYPAGLAILAQYEQYDPLIGTEARTLPLRELLADADPPTVSVLGYFATGVRDESGGSTRDFDLLEVPVRARPGPGPPAVHGGPLGDHTLGALPVRDRSPLQLRSAAAHRPPLAPAWHTVPVPRPAAPAAGPDRAPARLPHRDLVPLQPPRPDSRSQDYRRGGRHAVQSRARAPAQLLLSRRRPAALLDHALSGPDGSAHDHQARRCLLRRRGPGRPGLRAAGRHVPDARRHAHRLPSARDRALGRLAPVRAGLRRRGGARAHLPRRRHAANPARTDTRLRIGALQGDGGRRGRRPCHQPQRGAAAAEHPEHHRPGSGQLLAGQWEYFSVRSGLLAQRASRAKYQTAGFRTIALTPTT